MTSERIQQLFDQTLLGQYEDEEPWNAVSELHRNGSREIFEIGAQWVQNSESLKRARGAAILAQLREPGGNPKAEPKWLFRTEVFPLIANMLRGENDPLVLDSGIAALGFLYDAGAIPIIASYAGHLDENVRFSVAWALGHFPMIPKRSPGY